MFVIVMIINICIFSFLVGWFILGPYITNKNPFDGEVIEESMSLFRDFIREIIR